MEDLSNIENFTTDNPELLNQSGDVEPPLSNAVLQMMELGLSFDDIQDNIVIEEGNDTPDVFVSNLLNPEGLRSMPGISSDRFQMILDRNNAIDADEFEEVMALRESMTPAQRRDDMRRRDDLQRLDTIRRNPRNLRIPPVVDRADNTNEEEDDGDDYSRFRPKPR